MTPSDRLLGHGPETPSWRARVRAFFGAMVLALGIVGACGPGGSDARRNDGGDAAGSDTGGESGSGGAPGTGGAGGSGATDGAATGGVPGTGGTSGTGGLPATGGTSGTGGVPATGGTSGTGGLPATGGTSGTGGAPEADGGGGAGGAGALSKYIVVDQFGYLPDAEKIAVIRDPITGYDGAEAFTPGATYALVDAATGAEVLTGSPVPWNGGAEDPSSGDRAWWFDFSSVTTPGTYFVRDTQRNVRSPMFDIGPSAYRAVLKAAVRMFFYQRAGQAKSAQHAGAAWEDGASHVGANQDHACRRFLDRNNAATAKDLWGGWYDAGDFNKYTSWTAGYVIGLLHAYAERPTIWTDDYGIPESGNGLPDLVDEAKWGLDWLVRMQQSDGSVLSIVGEASASPPSAATGPSYYGDASTNATLKTAAAFAYAAVALKRVNNAALSAYADELRTKAESAWTWAVANPNVIFHNNSSANGTSGLGAGDQETDDAGRFTAKFMAAVYLFAATGKSEYKTFVDASYAEIGFVRTYWLGPWDTEATTALLDYTTHAAATAGVVSTARSRYLSAVKTESNLNTVVANNDPYGAYIDDYTWGSNATKSRQGLLDYNVVIYGLDATLNASATRAAARYVHYLHGVNPFQRVYLTNMGSFGAESSLDQIFHSWFADGSARWDSVATSQFGPAPGFLGGGPNPSYDRDGCCATGSCGSAANNALCTSESITPPKGQPPQKSYKDFNSSWPLNSWSVTEPSDGYQTDFIRLLSKFVP